MAKKLGLKDVAAAPLVEKEVSRRETRRRATGKGRCAGKVLLSLLVGIGAGLLMGRFFRLRI